MPNVSVIIPAYNQGHYLSGAIQSVLDQTYQDFEIIVVDDGSTDNTAEVAKSFSDTRVRYIYQKNGGLSAARNTGIRNSTGSYVTFLDSDDLFFPKHLDTLATMLNEKSDIGFVAGQTIPIDNEGNYLSEVPKSNTRELGDQFLLGNLLPVGSMMVRRCWLDKVGPFDESLRAYEDWELWLRLVRAGCQMTSVEQPVFQYRFHGEQMTRDGDRMRTATFAVLDKIYSDSATLPASWQNLRDQAYSYAHLRAAAHAYSAGTFANAKTELVEAVRLHPALCANNADLLAQQFARWADDPRTGNALHFLKRIYDNLPDSFTALKQRRRQELARMAMQLAYEAYDQGDLDTARSAISYAFYYQPRWLTNRGALSICAHSWLHLWKPKKSETEKR